MATGRCRLQPLLPAVLHFPIHQTADLVHHRTSPVRPEPRSRERPLSFGLRIALLLLFFSSPRGTILSSLCISSVA